MGKKTVGKGLNTTQNNNKSNPPPNCLVPTGKAQYYLHLALRISKKKSNLAAPGRNFREGEESYSKDAKEEVEND